LTNSEFGGVWSMILSRWRYSETDKDIFWEYAQRCDAARVMRNVKGALVSWDQVRKPALTTFLQNAEPRTDPARDDRPIRSSPERGAAFKKYFDAISTLSGDAKCRAVDEWVASFSFMDEDMGMRYEALKQIIRANAGRPPRQGALISDTAEPASRGADTARRQELLKRVRDAEAQGLDTPQDDVPF